MLEAKLESFKNATFFEVGQLHFEAFITSVHIDGF